MYTKTILDDAAIKDWSQSDSAQAHLKILQENALIIFRPGDYKKLSVILPVAIWGRLKEDLGHRRQSYRVLDETTDSDQSLSPEVVLGDKEQPTHPDAHHCKLSHFVDAPLVDRRARIKSGSEMVASREEFWSMCLRPIIDSQPPGGRTIEYFDAYAFQDSSKLLSKPRQGSVPTLPTHCGLGWLLSRVATCPIQAGRKTSFTIYTEIDPGMSKFSIDEISRALEQVTASLDLSNLEVTVVAFKLGNRPVEQRLHDLVHHRSLVINRKCRFHFNYGLKDADSFKAGEPKNDLPRTWSWFRELSPEWPNEFFPLLLANKSRACRLTVE